MRKPATCRTYRHEVGIAPIQTYIYPRMLASSRLGALEMESAGWTARAETVPNRAAVRWNVDHCRVSGALPQEHGVSAIRPGAAIAITAETVPLPRSVRLVSRLAKGTAIEVAGFGAGQVLRLASNLILTRLLFPEAFGLMAMLSLVLFGLTMLTDVGLGPAVIRSPRGDDPLFLDTVWSIKVLRGLSLWIVAALLAWPASILFRERALLLMIPVGLVILRLCLLALRLSPPVLVGAVLALCVIGTYAAELHVVNPWTALAFGVLGYGMRVYGFSAAAMVLGMVLGVMAESELRRSLIIAHGSWTIFLTRPVAAVLLFLTVGVLVYPLVLGALRRRRAGRVAAGPTPVA